MEPSLRISRENLWQGGPLHSGIVYGTDGSFDFIFPCSVEVSGGVGIGFVGGGGAMEGFAAVVVEEIFCGSSTTEVLDSGSDSGSVMEAASVEVVGLGFLGEGGPMVVDVIVSGYGSSERGN